MAAAFRHRFLVAALAAASAGLAGAAPADAPASNKPAMAPANAPIPLQDFIRHAQFQQTRISPTGKYLAVTAQEDGIVYLAVLRTEDLGLIKRTTLPDEKSIGQFFWDGDERLVFTAIRNIGRFAAPVGTGEWYAMNADGSQPRTLISYEARDATQRSQQIGYREGYSMLDPLPDDPKSILMQMDRATSNESAVAEVVAVDTLTGQRRSLARAPRHNCEMVLDGQHKPRFANCSDSKDEKGDFQENVETYVMSDDGKWKLIHASLGNDRRIRVIGGAPDGRTYAEQDDRKAPAAFGTLDPATGTFTKLFQDPVAAPENYIMAADRDTVIGVVSQAGKPKVELVDAKSPDTAMYLSVAQAFPGRLAIPTSATRDGKQILFAVIDDNTPTELYLFDRDKNQTRFLLRDRDWLDPKRMATVQPFSFKARDGLEMWGYLTIPKGVDLKSAPKLPMIVNPHGGPIGPRDDWGFNWETQMFASRGYLVLQLNYRGSGGYGQGFQDKGHGEWGGAMQDDLTDVTRWAIDKGYADSERICMYGGSYGGYASLMAAVKEPDLYRCVVGYVGVYDLVSTMFKKGDIKERKSGRRFLEHTLGTDTHARAENSPALNAGKIKAPVFLAAGMDDDRAPYQHTEAMRDALKAAGHPADEVILQDHEGHGFYKESNNLNLYSKMLAFFDRYIGNRRGRVDIETVEKPTDAAPAPAPADSNGTH